jgi:hypothetical protein
MATLTIAGAANKRAYSSYSKNQTTYTARSAIDATIAAVQNDSDFASSINSLNVGQSVTIDVQMPDSSMGVTTVTAECLKANQSYPVSVGVDPTTGQDKIEYQQKDLIKLTAVSYLGDASDPLDSSTVTLTYIKDYVQPSTSTGGVNNALTTMGNATLNVGLNILGGVASGINSSRWSDQSNAKYAIPTSGISGNMGTVNGNFSINGTFNVPAQGTIKFNNAGEGLKVFGDYCTSNTVSMVSEVTTDATGSSSVDYDKLPYIYVERCYQPGNVDYVGSSSQPVMVYCGGYIKSGKTQFYSDVYIYNHDFSKESTYDLDDGSNNGFKLDNKFTYSIRLQETTDASGNVIGYGNIVESNNTVDGKKPVTELFQDTGGKLIQWASNLVNSSSGSPVVSGSLYSEGSVIMGNSNYGGKIGGNCYVANDLLIKGSQNGGSNDATIIKGSLTVGGNLCIYGYGVGCNGYMYVGYLDCAPEKLMIASDNFRINDVRYGDYRGNTSMGTTLKAQNQKFIEAVNDAVTNNTGNISTTYDLKSNGSVSFPADKTLDKLLGVNGTSSQIVETADSLISNYTTSSGDFDTSVYIDKIPSTVDTSTRTFTSFEGMDFIKAYNVDGSQNTSNKLGEDAWYITNSCTWDNASFDGNNGKTGSDGVSHTSKKIYINPGSGEIWIEIKGNVSLSGQLEIVVDDSAGGKVNFFLDAGAKLSAASDGSGKIWTLKYRSSQSSTLELYQNQVSHDSTLAPKIYFYSAHDSSNMATLSLDNGSIITGYILAPYLNVSFNNPSDAFTIKYEGATTPQITKGGGDGSRIAVIGSAVVNDCKASNGTWFVYVSDKNLASTPTPTPSSSSGVKQIAILEYNNG